MANDLDEQEFGKRLIRDGVLTESQLRTSLEYQESLGGRLSDIILKLGFVPENILNSVVAEGERIRSIDLSGRSVDRALMKKIPRKLIEQYEVVPLEDVEGTVLLALTEARNFQAVEDIQFLTNRKIDTALAPRSQVRECITSFYDQHGDPDPQQTLAEQLLSRVADPAVVALARALIQNGTLDPEDWRRELE